MASPPIGFVILSHKSEPLLEGLIRALNKEYVDPPIVIHHDHSQSRLLLGHNKYFANVTVMDKHYRTRWGEMSIIDAFLGALRILYEKHAPKWFALISSSCYPVKPGSQVISELKSSSYDAYIGHYDVTCPPCSIDSKEISAIGPYLLSPSLPTHPGDVLKWLQVSHKRFVLTEKKGLVFGEGLLRCYVGDQWFTANQTCAEILIDSRRTYNYLYYHYTSLACPDESFCQTVLCNISTLNLCPSNRRLVNWLTSDMHPNILQAIDYPLIKDTQPDFARKFLLPLSNTLLKLINSR